jgi:glycosyltransferase involved in cell wall biosynthesis/galactose-1-phosphate uridylyltransferase
MTEQSTTELHQLFTTSHRKHILMITNHGIHQWHVMPGLPDTGGQNVFVNQFTEALAKFGFKVTIVNRGGYAHPETGELHSGLRYKDEFQRIVYLEDGLNEFVRKEEMAEQIPALVESLRKFLETEGTDVDLIISHYWDAAKLGILYNQTRLTPVKHIWVPHSLGAIKKRNVDPEQWPELRIDERIEIELGMIQDLDGIAATSSTIQHSLQDDYFYTGPSLFLPPCVDPDRYHPRHQITESNEIWEFLSQHSGLSLAEVRGCQIITEISRTDTTKRKDILIKAFAEVHQAVPNSLLVVSIDENRVEIAQQLKSLIKAHDIERHTAVVGSVWDILPTIYAVTDVYCTPSVMEGFGMTPQEAAATRVPVVSSHLVPFVVEYLLGAEVKEIRYDGDHRQPLRQGQGAIVVEADDVAGFAHALTMLLKDDTLRHEMGENAYKITIPYFTWGHVVNDFLEKIGVIGQQLSRTKLSEILEVENIEQLSFARLIELFQAEEQLSKFKPDGICQIDPRNGERIIYNSARARRPHDNRPEDVAPVDTSTQEKECAVCQGRTTGVVDLVDLGEGFTFINKNLFPALYPMGLRVTESRDGSAEHPPSPEGIHTDGFHFLQWTSSLHDKDWHNMPLADRVVVMKRLAALEKKLLTDSSATAMPATQIWDDQAGRFGFVSIIKNYGHLVGGSLAHGHQQIGFSNVMPRRTWDNWRFKQQQGEPFAAYMLRENPAELLIRDYGPAVLSVPYFMRRPFDMMLFLKDVRKGYLHELTEAEITAVAEGWHDAIRVMLWLMPQIGRETAYNVITNNGPGAGLYFEFLPYTQETGGFEHLGLVVCQGNPHNSATQIREFLEQLE